MTIRRKAVIIAGVALAILLIVAIVDFLYIKFVGSPVPVLEIPRSSLVVGEGRALTYAMLGDSRVVGQGGDYQTGVAVRSVEHLSEDYKVSFYNLGVSGARSRDVAEKQLPDALALKPDFVVIYIGANDVTHLTKKDSVIKNINQTIESLLAQNCDMKIVLTDAAAMWSVPRLPQPLRYAAGIRSKQLNRAFENIAHNYNLTFAPISAKTGEAFVRNHANFASDKFHPSEAGYTLLADALLPYLDKAITEQPSHCKSRSH